jgi:hypothetical protein
MGTADPPMPAGDRSKVRDQGLRLQSERVWPVLPVLPAHNDGRSVLYGLYGDQQGLRARSPIQ